MECGQKKLAQSTFPKQNAIDTIAVQCQYFSVQLAIFVRGTMLVQGEKKKNHVKFFSYPRQLSFNINYWCNLYNLHPLHKLTLTLQLSFLPLCQIDFIAINWNVNNSN